MRLPDHCSTCGGETVALCRFRVETESEDVSPEEEAEFEPEPVTWCLLCDSEAAS
jgi:hypothetical protein